LSAQEIRIPDIGDAEDVEVVEICVAEGDLVAQDAPLIVIESDKASMEVPATVAGRVSRIAVKVGDKVAEGQVIALVESAGGATAQPTDSPVDSSATAAGRDRAAKPQPASAPVEAAAPAPAPAPPTKSRRLEVRLPDVGEAEDVTVVELAVAAGAAVRKDDLLLVVESDKASMEIPAPADGRIVEVAVAHGSTVEEGTLLVVMETTDAADSTAQVTAQAPPPTEKSKPSPEELSQPPTEAGQALTREPSAALARVYAGPAVRRLARELGVDLSLVTGSGARGRIVKEDVQGYVKSRLTATTEPVAGGAAIPQMPAVDFGKFGPVETVALSRVRRRGAVNLHRAWLDVVHVTQHDEADVTDLEAFRAALKAEAAARSVKLTPLAFVVRALIPVLKAFPAFNASLDSTVEHLVLKRYYHIGFAVDTPEGLVVPVVRDADGKGVWELAAEIERLSAKARDGKLAPNEMSGGSFTVSSLGPIGGTGFTPIVNAPEVAILGVSRLSTRPHWNGSAFEPRQFLPVSLSYDHRAINGAEAGRFVTAFCATLADLRRVLL
jgi:pyruvate dehydrogenase E2 component (dihydrolipoamide acetyltransferase)